MQMKKHFYFQSDNFRMQSSIQRYAQVRKILKNADIKQKMFLV